MAVVYSEVLLGNQFCHYGLTILLETVSTSEVYVVNAMSAMFYLYHRTCSSLFQHTLLREQCSFKCSLVACSSMEWWEDSIGVMLVVVIIHVVCHWLKLMFLGGCPIFHHVHGWNHEESCISVEVTGVWPDLRGFH